MDLSNLFNFGDPGHADEDPDRTWRETAECLDSGRPITECL